MLTYYGLSLAMASGVSAGLTLPIAITGTISTILTGWYVTRNLALTSGYVYWPAVVMIGIFSVLGVLLGAMLAKRLPVSKLKRIFALVLVATAVELLW
jgi:uncharacterized membrane protein YfcA